MILDEELDRNCAQEIFNKLKIREKTIKLITLILK